MKGDRATRTTLLLIAALAASACHAGVAAWSESSTSQTSCTTPVRSGRVVASTPGNPFQALATNDGCWIFVSLVAQRPASPGVAVFHRSARGLSLVRVVPLPTAPAGMARTHDDSMLVVTAASRVTFLSIRALENGGHAILGHLIDSAAKGRVYASITADDRYAFIADENSQTVSVIDLEKARRTAYAASSTVGKIPTGTLPIAVTLTRDNRYMYVTSQWAPPALGWPLECKRETANPTNDTTSVHPQGAIHIVDVQKAEVDPAHAVIGNVRAGCSAVRLVLSPDERRAYVTARNSNALLAFDVAKLQSDPDHARVAQVQVGTAPVGVAVVDGGRDIIITNSNRFAGSPTDEQTLTIVDAAALETNTAHSIVGSVRVGAFPRELAQTSDGRTLILTNFGSKTIELIDIASMLPAGQGSQ